MKKIKLLYYKYLGVSESENLIMNKYCRLLKFERCDILKELRKDSRYSQYFTEKKRKIITNFNIENVEPGEIL